MQILKLAAATGVVTALSAAPALAHAGGGEDLAWSWDPVVLPLLGLAALWYAAGVLRLRARAGAGRVISRGQIATFAGGLATVFVALISPLDSIAGQLCSVHMIEHLLLMLVAAPLLVWSRPAIVFLWAFTPAQRRRIGRAWLVAGMGGVMRLVMNPFVVWVLFVGSFAAWHLPVPYQFALAHEGVHTSEHFCFFITSLAFWTIVLEPSGRRRLDYGPALAFAATAAMVCSLVGALLTLAPRPLYPAYGDGPAQWGLTLLQDQQLAGLVMWIPAGLIHLAAGAWLFLHWLRESERRAVAESGGARASPRIAHLFAIAVAGAFAWHIAFGAAPAAAQEPASVGGSGNPQRGAALIGKYGCGACHTIPGIDGANGLVGPPLILFGRRIYIAGMLRNTPSNLSYWIQHPQKVVPGNAMPDMGVTARDARDIAAYLDQLR